MKTVVKIVWAVLIFAAALAVFFASCGQPEEPEQPTFTVHYHANGGSGQMASSTFLQRAEQHLPKCTFTPPEGYVFDGWTPYKGNTTKEFNDGDIIWRVGDTVNLYALWRGIQYTVQYDVNGGTGAIPPSTVTYGKMVYKDDSYTLSENTFYLPSYIETITENRYGVNVVVGTRVLISRASYTFLGWAETPDGEVKYADGQSIGNLTKTDEATITLYAVWGSGYYVYYYPNNGAPNQPAVSERYAHDEEYPLRKNDFTRFNYIFYGWAESPDGPVVYADEQIVINLAETGQTKILYAVWRGTYRVDYHPNGGSGSIDRSVFVIDEPQNLPPNAFTRSYYYFAGWAASPSAATEEYGDEQSVVNLTTTAGGSVTLYAVWKYDPNAYFVSFDANDGSGRVISQNFLYGTEQSLRANSFTRIGYTFTGWAATASGAAEYTDSQRVTNLTAAGTAITLYAVWTGNPYTVRYNANEGSGTMSSQSFTYGTAQALTPNTFTRANYTFMGWTKDRFSLIYMGSVEFTDGESVNNLTTGTAIDLYALWGANYTVRYHANGGSGTMDDSAFIARREQSLPLNTFTRAGYTFTGWASSANATAATYTDGQSLTYLGGSTLALFAVWKVNTYTVAYNANGGSGTVAGQNFTYDTAQNLRGNSFSRTGYTFAGWSTSPDGAVEYTAGQSASNLTAAANGTVTLYAVWNGNAYTVVYNANGGSGSMSSQSFTYGTAQALTPNAFSRAGYTFAGWATSPGGAAAYPDQYSGSDLTTTASSVQLYAKWSGIEYTVNYHANGGSGSMSNQSFIYGTAQALTPNAFSNPGYGFAGWATSPGGAVAYANRYNGSDLTTTAGEAVSLYAKWSTTYTVKYDGNGNTGGSTADSVFTYGAEDTLRTNAFTRTGYTFAGWATSPSAATAQYTNEQSVSNLATTEETTVTLYAVWSGNPYTVIFNANGGGTYMPNQSFIYGTAQALNANTYSRAGYTFAGWARSSSAATADFGNGQSVNNLTASATITLYAVWRGNSYTVVFDKNASDATGTMNGQGFTYGTAQALPNNSFRRTGYAFLGWATSPSATTAQYADRESVTGVTTSGTITLYAVWTRGTFTVVYFSNGGIGSMASSTFTIGLSGQYLSNNTFTRTNYSFIGWSFTNGGTTASLTNGAPAGNLTNEAGSTVRLYAVWQYSGP